jgi:hypothetical protein
MLFFAAQNAQLRSVRLLIGLALICLALWGWLGGRNYQGVLSAAQIAAGDGKMYSALLPAPWFPFTALTDNNSRPQISPLRLSEDDRELGPAHALHATVSQVGAGAFSDWTGVLLFSTSDNSDPKTNGRVYRFQTKVVLARWLAAAMFILGACLCWPAVAALAPKTTAAVALHYGLLLCVPALTFFVAVGERTAPRATPILGANQVLSNRVAAYLEDPKAYNAIFLGDSRTYCGIHPELLEPLVPGLHALNLSNFSNWFATQLAVVRDIVTRIPPKTIVVWSVGHVDFGTSAPGVVTVQRVYPVGPNDAIRLTWWNSGRMPGGLFDNLTYYQPPLHAFVTASELRSTFDGFLNQPLFSSAARTNSNAAETSRSALGSSNLAAEVRAIEQQAQAEQDVVLATAISDRGRINSVVRYYRRGGYYRTEIDPSYFRMKQAELTHKLTDAQAEHFVPTRPLPMDWKAFLAILDLFAEHHIRLVVNELEEAPFVYGNRMVREKWRAMMRDLVQPEVEQRGFRYIRTHLDQLSDDDYFDYNHLNSKGVTKYMPMLARHLNELMANP